MAPSNIKIKVLDVIMEELGDKYQLEIDIITKSRGSGRKAVTGYKFYFFYEKYVKTVEEKITSKTQAKLQAEKNIHIHLEFQNYINQKNLKIHTKDF